MRARFCSASSVSIYLVYSHPLLSRRRSPRLGEVNRAFGAAISTEPEVYREKRHGAWCRSSSRLFSENAPGGQASLAERFEAFYREGRRRRPACAPAGIPVQWCDVVNPRFSAPFGIATKAGKELTKPRDVFVFVFVPGSVLVIVCAKRRGKRERRRIHRAEILEEKRSSRLRRRERRVLALRETMLEDQPLDLSVRVGDYAEVTREDKDEQEHHRDRKDLPIDDYGNAAAVLRLRGCFAASDYTQEREDRTCSEDSDDSCSDNNQKDGGTRSRSRPPGTKPYKKNLMRRYREFDHSSRRLSADFRHISARVYLFGNSICEKLQILSTGNSILLGERIFSQHCCNNISIWRRLRYSFFYTRC